MTKGPIQREWVPNRGQPRLRPRSTHLQILAHETKAFVDSVPFGDPAILRSDKQACQTHGPVILRPVLSNGLPLSGRWTDQINPNASGVLLNLAVSRATHFLYKDSKTRITRVKKLWSSNV